MCVCVCVYIYVYIGDYVVCICVIVLKGLIMNYYFSNAITDFYKGYSLVSISTGLFLLVLKHDSQNM